LDLAQLLELLRRHAWVIVATTAVGAVGASVVTFGLPPTYEGRATLIAPTLASTYAAAAESRPVLEAVIADEGLTMDPDDLARNVDAVPSQTSALLTIIVRDGTAARAAALANAIAERLVEIAPEIGGHSPEARAALERDLATVQAEIERVEAAIADLAARPEPTQDDLALLDGYRSQLLSLLALRVDLQDSLTEYAQAVVRILAPAVAPARAVSPGVVLAGLAGALVGFAIGLIVVVGPAVFRAASPIGSGWSPSRRRSS
jgi:capsular polysaccharide biosynthesis protein